MIAIVLIGLISGWLTGLIVKGHGYGAFADVAFGLVGGLLGAWMFGAFGVVPQHLIGAVLVTTLGATGFVMGTRLLTGEI